MKVYRYRSLRWIAIILIAVCVAVLVGLIVIDVAYRRAGGIPMSLLGAPVFLSWAGIAYAMGWVTRVELEEGELRVIPPIGKAKVFDLGEPLEARMREGESAMVLHLKQGKTKANIHDFIDDFAELRSRIEER